MRIGYTLMTEQTGPRELVGCATAAEEAGFDFAACSDHYSPWLAEQGHAPYAWSVLGAVAQATERIELMTLVTCPTMRYHPVVVAQKAATVQLLSEGRFTLGLGSGENLNEHVVGRGWPSVSVRHDRLAEAVQIIGGLFDGGTFTYTGQHYRADGAKLWDLSPTRVPLAIAVSGPKSVQRFAPVADAMVAVEPNAELCTEWDHARLGPPTRKIGQLPVSWDPDRGAAIRRAHEQFRWFGSGWPVNAELPGTRAFDAATQFVREDDVAAGIPCGPDAGPIVDAVKEFAQAGFTDVALVQIGGAEQQPGFVEFAERELLPALR
ncbi:MULTISPECIES: TIGR03557 family F420-dependent LLM class oxidoreductase [Amycolatopsis]|uniref:TIGR03557 family F420-dependent LLM class oxidoreductase n=1 Tax=Amycolatopsis albidoflavus TaxID=102226 RepID=A0ABW5HZP6_9PSEU